MLGLADVMHEAHPPPSPPSKLMSARSFRDDSVGVFDFSSVLDNERCDSDRSIEPHSDVDSYYSDAEYDHVGDDSSSDGTYTADCDDESSSSNEDDDVFQYVDDGADNESNDDDSDGTDTDHPQYWDIPYFTPRNVPDEDIPYTNDIFASMNDFNPPSSFVMQVKLQQLFHRNRASLKMYDDMISIINTYISSPDFNRYSKLLSRNAFLNRIEEIFTTTAFKPTYGSVVLHNNDIATVPVFDMKTMILSILHDKTLMRAENFAEGLDIFTGDVDGNCSVNDCYGEIYIRGPDGVRQKRELWEWRGRICHLD